MSNDVDNEKNRTVPMVTDIEDDDFGDDDVDSEAEADSEKDSDEEYANKREVPGDILGKRRDEWTKARTKPLDRTILDEKKQVEALKDKGVTNSLVTKYIESIRVDTNEANDNEIRGVYYRLSQLKLEVLDKELSTSIKAFIILSGFDSEPDRYNEALFKISNATKVKTAFQKAVCLTCVRVCLDAFEEDGRIPDKDFIAMRDEWIRTEYVLTSWKETRKNGKREKAENERVAGYITHMNSLVFRLNPYMLLCDFPFLTGENNTVTKQCWYQWDSEKGDYRFSIGKISKEQHAKYKNDVRVFIEKSKLDADVVYKDVLGSKDISVRITFHDLTENYRKSLQHEDKCHTSCYNFWFAYHPYILKVKRILSREFSSKNGIDRLAKIIMNTLIKRQDSIKEGLHEGGLAEEELDKLEHELKAYPIPSQEDILQSLMDIQNQIDQSEFPIQRCIKFLNFHDRRFHDRRWYLLNEDGEPVVSKQVDGVWSQHINKTSTQKGFVWLSIMHASQDGLLRKYRDETGVLTIEVQNRGVVSMHFDNSLSGEELDKASLATEEFYRRIKARRKEDEEARMKAKQGEREKKRDEREVEERVLSMSELFIVDNSLPDGQVLRYLRDCCQISQGIDIAVSYFEIGALLALEEEWKKVGRIRILLGDELSREMMRERMRRVKEGIKREKREEWKGGKLIFEQGFNFQRDLSLFLYHFNEDLELEKERDDFLTGVPAIVDALRDGRIECRVYDRGKFHAKAYMTHAREEDVGSTGLVGSSNFTRVGMTRKLELNVQITGKQVGFLQDWYEEYWRKGRDIGTEILRVIEPHIREYKPFYIYGKALREFLREQEWTVSEWERHESKLYSKVLAMYQQEGYHALIEKARKYGGAFLCDGVGLGKTFIGLMLIERLIHERKNVALFVPKSTRKEVWEAKLNQYLPGVLEGYSYLKIFNHTDLTRKTEKEKLERVAEQADVIMIDEAHHFRNRGGRYSRMYELTKKKQIFLLTATPINNRMTDFQHMIELFSRREQGYFRTLGIRSLSGHIKNLEESLYGHDLETDEERPTQRERLLQDELFQTLVVQRSRYYVKESIRIGAGDDNVKFPETKEPRVVSYSIKRTYGGLLDRVTKAFDKEESLFSFSLYDPYKFYKKDDRSIERERQSRRQVVGLIRTLFLKRFESSIAAFRGSCMNLFRKFRAWVKLHAKTEQELGLVEDWEKCNKEIIKYIQSSPTDLGDREEEEEGEEDVIPVELLDLEKELGVERLDREEFDIEGLIGDTIKDLDQLVEFLEELRGLDGGHDEKLGELVRLLEKDSVLSGQKVIIFTEFKDTARYLKRELVERGIEGVGEVDSSYKGDRGEVIRRFAPYYNDSSSSELSGEEIRVLVTTDVLSEGLNLQDAVRLINYDIHWNPVRLMQRIGRVDRRLDLEVEGRILRDHPEQEGLRGKIVYWNFLPPDELDVLLRLYERVAHKTLRISKTLGIEGKKLLTQDDDYDDLKNFTKKYEEEGVSSPFEAIRREYWQLLRDYRCSYGYDLEEYLDGLPLRLFSGKERIVGGTRGLFLCYRCPVVEEVVQDEQQDEWQQELGFSDEESTSPQSLPQSSPQSLPQSSPQSSQHSLPQSLLQSFTQWCEELDGEEGDEKVCWYFYDVGSGEIMEDPLEIIKYIRCTPETLDKRSMECIELSEIRKRVEQHIKNNLFKKLQTPFEKKLVLLCWMELV